MAEKFFLFKRADPSVQGGAVFSDNGKGISAVSFPAKNLSYMAADRGAIVMYFNESAPFEENSLTLAGESFEKTSVTVSCEIGREVDLMENIINFINKRTNSDVMKFDSSGESNTFASITPSPVIDARVRARPVERGLVGNEAVVTGLDSNAVVSGIDFIKPENRPFVDFAGENITESNGHEISTIVNSGIGGSDYDLVNDGPICRSADSACNSKTIAFDRQGVVSGDLASTSSAFLGLPLPPSLSNAPNAPIRKFKANHDITATISVSLGSLTSFTDDLSKDGTVTITRGGVDVTPVSASSIPSFYGIDSDGSQVTQCLVNNQGSSLIVGDVIEFTLENNSSINLSFIVNSDDTLEIRMAISRDGSNLTDSQVDELGIVFPSFLISTDASGNITSIYASSSSNNLLDGDKIYVIAYDPGDASVAHGIIEYTVSSSQFQTEFSRSVMQIVQRLTVPPNNPGDTPFPYTDYVLYVTLVIPPGALKKPLYASKYIGSNTFVSNMGPFPYDSLGDEFELNHGLYSLLSSSHPQSTPFEATEGSFPFVLDTQQDLTSELNLFSFVVRRSINKDLFVYSKDGELIASKKATIEDENTQLDLRYLGMVLPFTTKDPLIRIARFGVVGKDLGDLFCRNLATQLYNRYKHKASNLS